MIIVSQEIQIQVWFNICRLLESKNYANVQQQLPVDSSRVCVDSKVTRMFVVLCFAMSIRVAMHAVQPMVTCHSVRSLGCRQCRLYPATRRTAVGLAASAVGVARVAAAREAAHECSCSNICFSRMIDTEAINIHSRVTDAAIGKESSHALSRTVRCSRNRSRSLQRCRECSAVQRHGSASKRQCCEAN